MNQAMRSMVEEMRWAIANLACLLVPAFGICAGFFLTLVLVTWYFGSDVEGAFIFFFLAPFGCLLGLGVGALIGSKFIKWASDSEAHP